MLCVYSLKKKIRNIFYKFDLINNVNEKTFKIAKIKFYVSENFDRKIFFSRFIIFCKKKQKENILFHRIIYLLHTHNEKQCNLVKNWIYYHSPSRRTRNNLEKFFDDIWMNSSNLLKTTEIQFTVEIELVVFR